VNLLGKGSNFTRGGNVNLNEKYEATGGPTAKDCVLADRSVHFKSITLHPGCYDDAFPYLIAVSKDDKVTLRKFQIVEGYSCPIVIDEEKPGIKGFDCSWTKDGTIITYHVKRIKDTSPVKSQQVGHQRSKTQQKPAQVKTDVDILGSEMDDFECDDGSSIALNSSVRYCIVKEEYPPELLRTFDIV
jgi:hypothetical protein